MNCSAADCYSILACFLFFCHILSLTFYTFTCLPVYLFTIQLYFVILPPISLKKITVTISLIAKKITVTFTLSLCGLFSISYFERDVCARESHASYTFSLIFVFVFVFLLDDECSCQYVGQSEVPASTAFLLFFLSPSLFLYLPALHRCTQSTKQRLHLTG